MSACKTQWYLQTRHGVCPSARGLAALFLAMQGAEMATHFPCLENVAGEQERSSQVRVLRTLWSGHKALPWPNESKFCDSCVRFSGILLFCFHLTTSVNRECDLGFKADLEQIWYLSFYVDTLHSRFVTRISLKLIKTWGFWVKWGKVV